MSSLLPPSPSVSPGPNGVAKNIRASMGHSPRPTGVGMSLGSPRPGGGHGSARPASELLGTGGMYQATPEAEALDQWFENLQTYEVTLEEMAAASMDVNFKEELSAIEQWFKVLSEAERTAALYSLLQHSTQVQIRFFITVLQQMSRSDPMTALLSPAVGSMQSQMEAKLATMSLKSPVFASSPTARNFSMGSARSSSNDNFLSPEAANVAPGEAGGALAQQRAKFKAGNAANRISAPALAFGGNTWGSAASQLSQVDERSTSPAQDLSMPVNVRPKSTDFSGAANAFRPARAASEMDNMSPIVGDSWASMVQTPSSPMFGKRETRAPKAVEAAPTKLPDWSAGPHVPLMEDPKKFRRVSKTSSIGNSDNGQQTRDEAYHQLGGNGQQPGSFRNGNGNNGNNQGMGGGPGGWNNMRNPTIPPGRYPEDGQLNSGLGLNGFNMGMGSPGINMGMPSAGVLGGMQMSPFNMNMNMLNMAAMGMTPEAAQMLAAQMAAAGQFSPGAFSPGGIPFGMAMQQQQAASQRSAARSVRSPGAKSSVTGRGDKTVEEEIDPKVLEDIPTWLRTLRLHKYTPNFEGMTWRDMVVLDEPHLEAKGVAALGARRKMLKTFELVRAKYNIEMPPGSTTTTTSA